MSKTASMFQKCADWRRYHEMDERGNARNGGDSKIRSGKVLLLPMFSSDLLSVQKHTGMIHGKNNEVFLSCYHLFVSPNENEKVKCQIVETMEIAAR